MVIQDISEGGEFFVVQFDEEEVQVDIVLVMLYIDREVILDGSDDSDF